MNLESNRAIRIFCKKGQYGDMYSVGISKKQEDNTYLTSYLPIQFRKGTEIGETKDIYIKSAWLVPTKDLKVKIFINEYDLVSDVASKELNYDEKPIDSFEGFDGKTIDLDDELPF